MEAFLAAHPDFEVLQVGGGSLLPGARELKVPHEYSTYPRFVAWFRTVAESADFALAPLPETPFNAVKSDIKFLDYGLARLPAIYSATGPYGRTLENGVHGLLVENDPATWTAAMATLASDGALAQRIREQARELAASQTPAGEGTAPWMQVLAASFDVQAASRAKDRRSAA